jgi:hypothetical protein
VKIWARRDPVGLIRFFVKIVSYQYLRLKGKEKMTDEQNNQVEAPAEQPVFEEPLETISQPELPNEIKNETKKRKKRPSIFFPLLLITLGIVFLLKNLNVISGDAWDILINLWPVLLIMWGLDEIWRGDSLTGAAFLIGLGGTFLLSNFGYLNASVWQVFLILWPVLLISIGLDILFSKRRSIWLQLLGIVIILAILAGSLWITGVSSSDGQFVEGEEITVNLNGAEQAQVQLLPGAGSLTLDKLSIPDILLAGTIPLSTPSNSITQEYIQQGDLAILTLQSTGTQFVYLSADNNENTWDLGLTNSIPIDLKVDLGAGDITLDLTGLQILRLQLNLGVGRLKIILPQEGDFDINVDGGVGQVTIVIPDGVGVKINTQTGLVNRSVPENFINQGNSIYLSPNYKLSIR